MTTIEKLYAATGRCPCCDGQPEICVDGMCPTEIFVRCRDCRLSTRRRRTASVIYPQAGTGGTLEERLDAAQRRQNIRLVLRSIADWNRRPAAPKPPRASRPPSVTAPSLPPGREWHQEGFALISEGPGGLPMYQEFRCGHGEIVMAEAELRRTIPESFHARLLRGLCVVKASLKFAWPSS